MVAVVDDRCWSTADAAPMAAFPTFWPRTGYSPVGPVAAVLDWLSIETVRVMRGIDMSLVEVVKG
jgi:hypothetical protein